MANKTALFSRKTPGGVFSIYDETQTTGSVFFVDSGSATNGATSGFGDNPDIPLDTIDNAINRCVDSNGDRIFVMPGHTETLTASIAMDTIGVSIIGMGEGLNRPQITGNGTIDNIDVTAANCLIQNLYFNESTAVATSNINVNAADCTIRNCHMDVGDANNLEAITIEAAGIGCIIEDNTYVVTGDGPDTAIEIESATTDRTTIRNNIFVCSEGTNAFDAAAINSTVANTNLLVTGNTFLGAGVAANAVVAASAVDKTVVSNLYGGGTESVDSDIFSGDVHITAEPAPLVVDDRVWYVDSADGNASFDGHTPRTAFVTIAAAIAAGSAGDTIVAANNHAETITTKIDFSKAGMSLIGSGNGARRPSITGNLADDIVTISAANVLISNILFNEATVTGGAINIGAADAKIIGCKFDLGANDAEAITIEDAGDRAQILDTEFIISANGPTSAIRIEAAGCDGLEVAGNTFNGGNSTNVWDTAAISTAGAHTNTLIHDNTFMYGTALSIDASISSSIYGNTYSIGCRPSADSPLTFWAADGRTAVGDGTPSDPTTIVDAVDRATAAGDVVNLLPGSYTLTAALAMDVAGTTLQAAPGHGPQSVTLTTATADISLLTVTGDGCLVQNVRLANTATMTGNNAMINSDATGAVYRNLRLDFASNDMVDGIDLGASKPDCIVEDCVFILPTAGEVAVSWNSAQTTIRRNHFDHTAAAGTSIEQATTNINDAIITHNTFNAGGADHIFITWDGTVGAGHVVAYNSVHDAGTTNEWLGNDAGLDTMFLENYAGTTAGATTAINPSVT